MTPEPAGGNTLLRSPRFPVYPNTFSRFAVAGDLYQPANRCTDRIFLADGKGPDYAV